MVALSEGPNRASVSLPLHEDRIRLTFRNVVFSSIQNSEWWTKSRNPVILRLIIESDQTVILTLQTEYAFCRWWQCCLYKNLFNRREAYEICPCTQRVHKVSFLLVPTVNRPYIASMPSVVGDNAVCIQIYLTAEKPTKSVHVRSASTK
jgi:hypothetical protein